MKDPKGFSDDSADSAADNTVVVSLIRQNKMEDAARLYRELHGTSLDAAQAAVEALAKKP